MRTLIARFIREDAGQDLIEYALLAAFIALAALVGMQALGIGVNTLFGNVNTRLGAASAP